jgi:hypothetical protein
MLFLLVPNNVIQKEKLVVKVNSWSPNEKKEVVHRFLLDEISSPNFFPMTSSLFSPIPQQMISMISLILGNDDDSNVDEFLLYIMNDISPSSSSSPVDIFAKFMETTIHEQLCAFHDFKMFQYQSYLMHLFFIFNLIISHILTLGSKMNRAIHC